MQALDCGRAVAGAPDDYLYGPRAAWFAFAMTAALMLFDYVDRQVIVSLFPHIKDEWGLSDKQLGALVSIVSVTVALGALPVALIADRMSRVKSIFWMAPVWSARSAMPSLSRMSSRTGRMAAPNGVLDAPRKNSPFETSPLTAAARCVSMQNWPNLLRPSRRPHTVRHCRPTAHLLGWLTAFSRSIASRFR